MDRETFFNATVDRLRALFVGKNAQYKTTGPSGEIWGNLVRIATFTGLAVEQVAAVLIAKHLLVLATPENLAADGDGGVSRADDIAIYAMLVAGRIKDTQ